MKKLLGALLLVTVLTQSAQGQTSDRDQVDEFIRCTFSISEVMLHDVVNPPAASRFYAYSLLGAYKALNPTAENQKDLTAKFKSPFVITGIRTPSHFIPSFAAMYAMLETGRLILPSGYLLEEKQSELVTTFRTKYHESSKHLDENVVYAQAVASAVLKYSRDDGYSKLSAYSRYKADTRSEGRWFPTPPEYMSAVEPQWNTIRTFFLDSAAQFEPPAPASFNKNEGSAFYTQLNEVYKVGNSLTQGQKEIAAFWDCNPFAVTYSGHLAIGLKKISPGGHWIGITGIACRNARLSLEKTIYTHTLVALTLHDAFISCWHEKYKSDRIRPESAINKYLDPSWRPLLQTPPFPEYTSGHSVISTAAAEILTSVFGEKFSFTDTSEEYFGLPARTFQSFREAADEAAISRLYGGIHFRDAIEAGQQQGKAIGKFITVKTSNAGRQQ